MPIAWDCAGSVAPAEIRIDQVNRLAESGKAGHEVMHHLVDTEAETLFDVDFSAIAQKYDLEESEVRIAAFGGLKLWKQIKDRYQGAQGEIELRHSFDVDLPDGTTVTIELSGHPDLLVVDGEVARGGDWKFGRVDHDFRQQMLTYCVLVFLAYPDVKRIEWSIFWMRESDEEFYTMTREEVMPWLETLAARVVMWDGTFRTGPHCTHCPRSYGCPAAMATWKRDVEALTTGGMLALVEAEGSDVPARMLGDFFLRAKAIDVLCARARAAVRDRVEKAGGHIDLGDGTELRIDTTNRREVDAVKAWSILEAHAPDSDLGPFIEIRLAALESAVSAAAGRGRGAEARRRLTKELENAGAITHTPVRRLTAGRKKGDR